MVFPLTVDAIHHENAKHTNHNDGEQKIECRDALRVSIVHGLQPYKDFRFTARGRNPRAGWGVRTDRRGYNGEVAGATWRIQPGYFT
jgi:hypothetical protein